MIARLLAALDRTHCALFGHEWRVWGYKSRTVRRAYCGRCLVAQRLITISVSDVS